MPSIAPEIFPDSDKASWIDHPEYEIDSIQRIKEKIVEIRQKAHIEVSVLEQAIKEEKEKYSFLYDLTRTTGETLVEAVIKTLETLGFKEIVDVDKELEAQGIKMQNREDLQIHDSEPTLIIEVKGISNFPSDEDALTVQKYVILRMREWERVAVQGITIINHQRHLPPLDRDNEMPFRQEILDVATEQKIGLLTAWDLHRLARSFIKNNWKFEYIHDLFYQTGRIQPIPTHYEYVGTINRYIEEINVLGIQVEQNTFRKGNRIAFELPVSFEEQDCNSLQFENNEIFQAQLGMLVGIKTHLTKEQVKLGTRVFKIKSFENSPEYHQQDA